MIAIKPVISDDNVCLLSNYLIRIEKSYFVAKPVLSYEQRENDVWYPLKDCYFVNPNNLEYYGVKSQYISIDEIGQII